MVQELTFLARSVAKYQGPTIPNELPRRSSVRLWQSLNIDSIEALTWLVSNVEIFKVCKPEQPQNMLVILFAEEVLKKVRFRF